MSAPENNRESAPAKPAGSYPTPGRDISHAIRHRALTDYIAELDVKRKKAPANRALVSEELAARAALLRLEREASDSSDLWGPYGMYSASRRCSRCEFVTSDRAAYWSHRLTHRP